MPDPKQNGTWQRHLMIPVVLILAGIAALSVDVPLSRLFVKEGVLNRLDEWLDVIEKFGNAIAVGVTLIVLGICDPRRRSAVPRMAAAALGAGLVTDAIKLLVGRVRPLHYDFAGSVFDTFRGWLPGLTGGAGSQSFPSAHVATAVGFAVALGACYPGGRRLFAVIAGLVALQRVEDGAHFLSDTLWGAAIGYAWATLLFQKNALTRGFDRWEAADGRREARTSESNPTANSGHSVPAGVPLRVGSESPVPTLLSLAQAGIDKLSIVVPVFNEQENVPRLYEAVTAALADLRLDYEFILVDDGSTDRTDAELQQLANRDERVKVVTFRRNYGQTAAMNAGMHLASGDAVVLLDGDLQNDPTDIPLMLAKLIEGYDLVHGWRKDRHDRFLDRRLPSLIANWIISRVTGFPVHDLGCTLKVIRREIAQELQLYGEMHRFIPILAAGRGARCTEVVTKHHARQFGTSKYGISRTVRVILDLITVKFLTHYFVSPMKLFGKLGLGAIAVGALSCAATIAMKLLQQTDMTGNPLLLATVFATLLGVQFLCLGVLGEVAVRTYYESQQQSSYAIRRLTNFPTDSGQKQPSHRAA